MFSGMNNADFSEWLNKEIKARGVSQAEIARRAGVSKASISKALDLQGMVGWDVAYGIALALGLPPLIVFRKAGLVPAKRGDDALRDEALILFDELERGDQEEVIEFMKMKYRRAQSMTDAQNLESTIKSLPPDAIDEIVQIIDSFMQRRGMQRAK